MWASRATPLRSETSPTAHSLRRKGSRPSVLMAPKHCRAPAKAARLAWSLPHPDGPIMGRRSQVPCEEAQRRKQASCPLPLVAPPSASAYSLELFVPTRVCQTARGARAVRGALHSCGSQGCGILCRVTDAKPTGSERGHRRRRDGHAWAGRPSILYPSPSPPGT